MILYQIFCLHWSPVSCDEGQLCDTQKAPCAEGVNLLQWPKMGKWLSKAMALLRNYKCHSLMCIKNLFLYLILPFMIYFSSRWYWIFWKAKDSRERDVTVRKTADKPVSHIFCWSKSLSFQLLSSEIPWFTQAEDLALYFQELTNSGWFKILCYSSYVVALFCFLRRRGMTLCTVCILIYGYH